MELTKIVITGGPCAGKTTASSWIQNAFAKSNVRVIFIPETATELISGGVAPWTCGSNLEYQKCQMRLQLEKEAIFAQAAKTMDCERILLVCDRGALDNKAYMNQEEFQSVMDHMELNEIELRDSYDAVFHLVTAANGSEKYYTTANNQARVESVEQAIELDDKIIASWAGHPHLRVIDNSTGFNEKMKRLLDEINAFLGEPQAASNERKFLVRVPDLEALLKNVHTVRVEITQTYLNTPQGVDKHVRRRGVEGHFFYYLKTKRTMETGKVLQVEQRLTEKEYTKLLQDASPLYRPLEKTRYCFSHKGQYMELDVYPLWGDTAILRSNESGDKIPELPVNIEFIKDVSHDPAYSNSSIAKL